MINGGDFIVYADESGDHGATSAQFPVFVLAFCIFNKRRYSQDVTTALTDLKFKWFGHDAVVLHEREIRKQQPPYNFLAVKEKRDAFMTDVGTLIEQAPFTLIATVIRKERIVSDKQKAKWPVYETAMRFGLERVAYFLEENGQGTDTTTHVIFETRGKTEDNELELEFRRRAPSLTGWDGKLRKMDIVFAPKTANHCGHQIADLIARPIGLSVLRPDQPNRSFEIIEKKFRRNGAGKINGWGLKVFP